MELNPTYINQPTKIGRWVVVIIAIILVLSFFYYDYYIRFAYTNYTPFDYFYNNSPGFATFILISFIFGYYFDLLSLSPSNPILKYSIYSLGIISIFIELLIIFTGKSTPKPGYRYVFYLAAFGIAVFGFLTLYETLINTLRLKRGSNPHWWKLMLVGLIVGIFSLILSFLLIVILPLLAVAH